MARTNTLAKITRSALGWRGLLVFGAFLAWPAVSQAASESDIALFSSSSGAPPNIMLLLDDSGSMDDDPSWCTGGSGGSGRGGRSGGGGAGECDDDGGGGFGRGRRGGGRRGGRGGRGGSSGGSSGSGGDTCDDADDPVLDCRPKWEIMRDAAINMVNVMNPSDGVGGYAQNVRFGIFMFDDSHNGGMLIEPIADDNTADILNALNTKIDADGSTPLGGSLVDIGRYFAGATKWGTGITALPQFGTLAYAASAPEPTQEQNVPSPMDLSCRESFVIALSDGDGQDTSGSKYPNANLWATVGDADSDGQETLATSEEWFDDAAYKMARTDFQPGISGTQNIETHTIAFDLGGSGATLLKNAATYGNGTYYEANSDLDLSAAFLNATANIFASLGSFTGATVASSRSRQGDLFINSWFAPSDKPIWAGHLQAFRVAPDGDIQTLESGAYVDAIDPLTDKLIKPPLWDAADKVNADTSRRIVTADASYNATPIDLTPSNVSNAEMGIDSSHIDSYPNVASLGIDTTDELRAAIIAYVRGFDAFDQEDPAGVTDLRDPVLGDFFHSTPIMIGPPSGLLMHEPGYATFHSTYEHRDRVVYAGTNGGMLHAFDAGEWKTGDDPLTTDTTENGYYSFGTGPGGANGGEELWGYVPRRLLDEIPFIPVNSPRVNYYVDGSPTAADAWLGDKAGGTAKVKDANEWATVLVSGFRNGGRGYVALDITDPSSGSYPKVLWEFTDTDLGDSWSQPIITRIKMAETVGYGDHCGANDGDGDCREQWVAIFGGGFKSNANPNDEDYGDTTTHPNWTFRSKAIFVVALDTGNLLAKIAYDASDSTLDDMKYAIPGSPAVLDLDFDGFADVVYIGDVGGQMWKWDISNKATTSGGLVNNWTHGVFFKTPVTDLGSGNYHYRSFFEAPAATYVKGELALAFGSGEREGLFYAGSPSHADNNRFYVIRDPKPYGTGSIPGTPMAETDATITDVTDGSNQPGVDGYYIEVQDGEKFIAEPTIFAGYVIAATFNPQAGSNICITATGQASLYVFQVATGIGYFDDGTADVAADRYVVVGGGLPSKPKVSTGEDPADDVVYIKTSSGQIITFDPPPRPSDPVGLIYWRQVF